MPLSSYAQSTQQLEQQLANLLTQIDALQKLINSQSNLPITTGDSVILDGSVPLALPYDLNTGDSGNYVSLLQQHLARDPNIYPEALVTGNYFTLTTAAVRRFQVACGLVTVGDESSTGFGRVGPRTRNALQFGCPGRIAHSTQGTTVFNARNITQKNPVQSTYTPPSTTSAGPVSPTSGPLPLSVTAKARFTTLPCNTATSTYRTYRINYDDGAYEDVYYKLSGAVDIECGKELTRVGHHTYTKSGSYTIKLEEVGPSSNEQAGVLNSFFMAYITAGPPENTAPQPTIQVRLDGNPSGIARGNTVSISWTAVNAPSNSAVRLELRRGTDGSPVGEAGIVNDLPVNGSYTWQIPQPLVNTACASGTGLICPNYITENSTYRVRAFLYEPRGACWGSINCYGGNLASSRAIANTEAFTILPFGAISSDAFIATPSSGASPLAVVFNVQANQGGSCTAGTYSIDFGDGTARQDLTVGSVCGIHVFVASHTYTTAGTWTAKFYNVPSSSVTTNMTPLNTRTITVTGDSQTSLLLSANGAQGSTSFIDSSGHHTFTVQGNTAISTTQSKSGGSSVFFDGNGDYLDVSDGGDLDIGVGGQPFTVEAWIYRTSGNTGLIFGRGGGARNWNTTNGHMYGLYFENGVTYFTINSNGSPASIHTIGLPQANTWVHVAVTYDNATFRLFINGVQQGAVGVAGGITAPTTRNATRIGRFVSTDWSLAPRSCPDGYTMVSGICTATAQCSIYFIPAAIVWGDSATVYWSAASAGTMSYPGGSFPASASGSGSTGGQNGQTSTYTFTPTSGPSCSAALAICPVGAVCNEFTGWIDELRITKGTARWTSNFTPPTN